MMNLKAYKSYYYDAKLLVNNYLEREREGLFLFLKLYELLGWLVIYLRACFSVTQELLQVHELPMRREEARGEIHGRPGVADRHVRGPAPARPAAALPAPAVAVH